MPHSFVLSPFAIRLDSRAVDASLDDDRAQKHRPNGYYSQFVAHRCLAADAPVAIGVDFERLADVVNELVVAST